MDPRPETFKSSFQEWITIITVMTLQTLSQYGTNITMPMMNQLGDSFTTISPNDKVWFMAAFPLTSGTFILISGKFGDLYGLKKILMYGSIWSIIWSLVCGLSLYAKNVIFFCVCRGMQGIGIAFVLPTAIGIIGHVYKPGERKAMVFALIGGCGPLGACIAAIVGGLCAQFNAVHWAFYTSAFCFLIITITTWIWVPFVPTLNDEKNDNNDNETPSMDWLGAILAVLGLLLFNFSFNQASEAGWNNPYIIILLILGLIFIVAFAYVEGKAKDPILPKEVLNLHTSLILFVVGLGWGSFSIWVFYYWSTLLNICKYEPIMAGLTYITFMVFGGIASCLVGLFIKKIRPTYILVAASIAFVIGIGMLSGTPINQTFWKMFLPQMIILSFGMDMSFPSASLILSDNLPKRHQGMASSLVSTVINYSMSICLGFGAIAETQVFSRYQNTLKSYRAAEYVGVGLAVVGFLLALVLHFTMGASSKLQSDEEKNVIINKESFLEPKESKEVI